MRCCLDTAALHSTWQLCHQQNYVCCADLSCCLQALRKLTFRHMNMVLDAPPRKTRPYYGDSDYDGSDASDDYDYYHAYHNHQDFDKYGPYTKAWQQVWVGCSQLAYLQVER